MTKREICKNIEKQLSMYDLCYQRCTWLASNGSDDWKSANRDRAMEYLDDFHHTLDIVSMCLNEHPINCYDFLEKHFTKRMVNSGSGNFSYYIFTAK